MTDKATGLRCPYCGGTKLQKRGYTLTLSGHKQRYICLNCAHTFTTKVVKPVGVKPEGTPKPKPKPRVLKRMAKEKKRAKKSEGGK